MAVQAIAGVSASEEARIMTEFPSVAANGLGRLIGEILTCIPVKIWGVQVSYLLFGLPLAPLGLLLFLLRLTGIRYVLTNRSVQIWSTMGSQQVQSADLLAIDSVQIEQLPGQAFFRAADIRLKDAGGKTLLLLRGVADAQAFKSVIDRAVESRRLVSASLRVINNRS
ncbi:MAG: hypothetical protein ACPGXX_10120 [Planctomycetaceae bacterium]|jgi:hypothetical protein